MSMKIIYGIIREKGGEATTAEIREVIRKRYPKKTLKIYVANRLRKLEGKGVLKLVEQKGKRKGSIFRWRIVSQRNN